MDIHLSLSMAEFLEIKSTHSLVAKHVAKELWDKLFGHETATSGFTLAKAIACAVQFDDQHCGIYAGDVDSYMDFASVFDSSSRSTMLFPLTLPIPVTWTLARLMETSMMMSL